MGDILSECAQQLRSSKFDFEVLLGASVGSVWQALGRHVTRQLTQHKGVSIQQLGKFGFYKTQTSTLSATPVFLLADRFASIYNVVWRNRQPPAPLTVTGEVSMAALGNDASLGHDQTRRALDAILAFVGKKLQIGECSGKLVLAGVGSFSLEGKALSFSFDPRLLRTVGHREQDDKSPPSAMLRKSVNGGLINNLRRKAMLLDAGSSIKSENPGLRRSASVDSALQPHAKSKYHLKALVHFENHEDELATQYHHNGHDDRGKHLHNGGEVKTKRRPRQHRQDFDASPLDNNIDPEAIPINGRQILPRFLIPEPRVPSEVLNARPKLDQVMQSAYQREDALINQAKRLDDEHNEMIATRQRVVKVRDLQLRAEHAVSRRELNAFLNNQIEEKRNRSRQKSASDERDRCGYRDIKILPLEREVSDETQRAEKKKLNQRLNEQVAAKLTLRKDRRALDQAESAYFISKLRAQEEIERQEMAERNRVEKEALLAGWSQQKAICAQKKTLNVHLK